jgi:hypothetical protein
MDVRLPDEATQLRETIDRALMQVHTCIPANVESFDPATQTVTVQPAILMKTNVDGVADVLELPKLINVPLVFPFAITAGFALTLPVRKGDSCILHFSQRSIDNWHRMGGLQPPEEGVGSRHHDLTDAFATLAASPLPSVLGAWEADGIELRNRDKSSRVTVKDETIQIECGASKIVVNADGTVTIDASTSATITTPETYVNGNLTVTGLTTTGGLVSQGTAGVGGVAEFVGGVNNTGGDITADGISLETHIHNGVQTGTGTSGEPE